MVLVITAVENFFSGQVSISTDRDGPGEPTVRVRFYHEIRGEIGVKLQISTRKVGVKLVIPILEIGLADESEFIL